MNFLKLFVLIIGAASEEWLLSSLPRVELFREQIQTKVLDIG